VRTVCADSPSAPNEQSTGLRSTSTASTAISRVRRLRCCTNNDSRSRRSHSVAGIRRRKPVHHLPKSHAHYSDAELGRVFGQFRWSAYSPAGSVERAGFLARQWSRARRHPEWNEYNHKTKLVGAALLALVYLGVLLFATVSLGARMFGS
jgi:hypothetical protein